MDWFIETPDAPPPPLATPPRRITPAWWSAPEEELAVLIRGGFVVARTEHMAVAVAAVWAHSVGVRVDLLVVARRGELSDREWARYEAALFRSRETLQLLDRPEGLRLLVGVEDSGGRRAVPAERGARDFTVVPELSVTVNGGGTGGREGIRVRPSLWVWPIPADGDLDIHVAVPGLGLEDHVVSVDGAAARAASMQVVQL